MCATNYPSDLTSEQWQLLRPLLPKPAKRGPPLSLAGCSVRL